MRKKSVIRTILCIVACSLLLYCVLYYIPFPTRINFEMTCTEITTDGQALNEGTIHFKGWKLNYLLRDAEVKLNPMSFPGFSKPLVLDPHMPLHFFDGVEPPAIFGQVREEGVFDIDALHSINISVQDGWKTCMIRLDGERFFVCTANNAYSISDIMNIHSRIFDFQ